MLLRCHVILRAVWKLTRETWAIVKEAVLPWDKKDRKKWKKVCPYNCVYTQKMMFPLLFLSSLYQGSSLSLTIAFVSLVDFQTASKMMSRLSGLAGHKTQKT